MTNRREMKIHIILFDIKSKIYTYILNFYKFVQRKRNPMGHRALSSVILRWIHVHVFVVLMVSVRICLCDVKWKRNRNVEGKNKQTNRQTVKIMPNSLKLPFSSNITSYGIVDADWSLIDVPVVFALADASAPGGDDGVGGGVLVTRSTAALS